MPRHLLLAFFALSTAAAAAGPVEGELFGYKLGAKYPVGKNTAIQFGQALTKLRAEHAKVPRGFGDVELVVTPMSYTILSIGSENEFKSTADAEAFARRQSELIGGLYGDKCLVRSSAPQGPFTNHLSMLCPGAIEVTVSRFAPPPDDGLLGGHDKVWVSLAYASGSPQYKRLSALLETENAAKRSEQARRSASEDELRGLQ
jgi:hypothetical protein